MTLYKYLRYRNVEISAYNIQGKKTQLIMFLKDSKTTFVTICMSEAYIGLSYFRPNKGVATFLTAQKVDHWYTLVRLLILMYRN
jgi:hypothetical protein